MQASDSQSLVFQPADFCITWEFVRNQILMPCSEVTGLNALSMSINNLCLIDAQVILMSQFEGHQFRSFSSGVIQTKAQILPFSLNNCVTLGEQLNLSENSDLTFVKWQNDNTCIMEMPGELNQMLILNMQHHHETY